MEDQERLNNIFFGLIGKNISYSFSKTYFSKKFKNLQLSNSEYLNFDFIHNPVKIYYLKIIGVFTLGSAFGLVHFLVL